MGRRLALTAYSWHPLEEQNSGKKVEVTPNIIYTFIVILNQYLIY